MITTRFRQGNCKNAYAKFRRDSKDYYGMFEKGLFLINHTFDRPFLLHETVMFKWYGVCIERLFSGGGAESPV